MVNINRILCDMYAEDGYQIIRLFISGRVEFLAGRSSLEDEERSRQPHGSVTLENI